MQVLNSLLYWPTITLSCPSNSGCPVDRQRCSTLLSAQIWIKLWRSFEQSPHAPANKHISSPKPSPPEAPFRLELCPRAAGLTSLADDDTNRAALLLFYPPASQFSQRVAADPGGHNLDFAKPVPHTIWSWDSEEQIGSEANPLAAVMQFSSLVKEMGWQQVPKLPKNPASALTLLILVSTAALAVLLSSWCIFLAEITRNVGLFWQF